MTGRCETTGCVMPATHKSGWRDMCYRHFAETATHFIDLRNDPALNKRAEGIFTGLMEDRCFVCRATRLTCRGHEIAA